MIGYYYYFCCCCCCYCYLIVIVVIDAKFGCIIILVPFLVHTIAIGEYQELPPEYEGEISNHEFG